MICAHCGVAIIPFWDDESWCPDCDGDLHSPFCRAQCPALVAEEELGEDGLYDVEREGAVT